MARETGIFVRHSLWRLAVVTALACLLGQASASDPFDIPPAVPPRVLDAAYFGTHFHRLDHADSGHPETRWPVGLIGSVRLWDSSTRWADIERAPGQFDFTRLDELVAQARAQGANVLLVLGSTPAWASARPREPGPYGPGCAAEPADLASWDRYVEAVVRRYKGRIAQYELWNEPYFSDLPQDRNQPGAFFTGSVAMLVELARRARAVIAAEDPQAQLLTPGFVGGPNRLEMFLAGGGGRYVDAVAYHFYADDDEGFLTLYREVRAVMARHAMAGMALIDSESGFAIRGVEGQPRESGELPIDRHAAAALLARSMILGAFLGVDRFYQYAWDNDRMGVLMPDGRTATDSLRAYTAVRRWLLGTTLLGCRSIAPVAVRCDGIQKGERVFIAWRTTAGGTEKMSLPDGLAATAVDSVTQGRVAVEAPGPREFALPDDGMPIAVRGVASGSASHTDVIHAR